MSKARDLAGLLGASSNLTVDTVTSTSLDIGSWQIKLDGSNLRFVYNSTDVFSVTTSGEIIALDDVTAFGTP